MPGLRKIMQRGRNNPLFFQTLPSQTPKQVKEEKIQKKIDEVYGKGYQAPYDDDGPYGQEPKRKSGNAGFRMVKNNLTGRQMKIAKQTAPFDEINGADFAKLREALMGRGKVNAKVYQDGTGSGDRTTTSEYFDQRRAQQAQARRDNMSSGQRLGEGVFSQAVQSMDSKAQDAVVPFAREIEGALANESKWAEDFAEKISAMGYSMDDLKSGKVPAHTIASVTGRSGQAANLLRSSMVNQGGLDMKDANYLIAGLSKFGRNIEDGIINVSDMDNMMGELGYTSDDAAFMGDAISKGGMDVSQFNTRRMEELGEGGGQRDVSGGVEAFPSANEFRKSQKNNTGRDGSYKGGYGKNNVTFGREKFRETDQTMRPDEDFPAQELPQEVVQNQPDPIDPIQGRGFELERPEPTRDIIPPPQVEEKPDPVVQEKPVIRGCMDPKSTNYNPRATEDDGSCAYPPKEEEEQAPAREPLGRFDIGGFEPMPSDKLGEGGAMGRYSDAMLGQELRNQAAAAGVNRMGSALKAKLNAMGRKYNTMGSINPKGMRFVRRR